MDTIITGVGCADGYTAMLQYIPSWLNQEESEKLSSFVKSDLVVGDLGGYLIPSSTGGENTNVLNFIQHVNRRMLGARPTDFAHIAQRHRQTNMGGGVIVVACGARKAKILQALLSRDPCPIS